MKIKKRKYYFERISNFIGKGLIKVITGQRRSGKSYFLLQLMEEIKKMYPGSAIVYIDKEQLKYKDIKDFEDLVQYAESNKGGSELSFLFIDEVQEIKQFEKALRHLLSSGKWDIYVTGSNADILSGELATLLSGRYIAVEMLPLSYDEFLSFHSLTDNPASFEKYIRYGGMPYLYHLPLQQEVVYEYLQNITDTILYKDVVARHGVRNIEFLENLMLFLSDNIGHLISAHSISRYLKSQNLNFNHNTVIDYLNYLSKAFITHRVKRFDLKGKRILEIGEKDYFTDIGIRNSIIGFDQNDTGKIFENMVYNHLIRKNYKVYVGKLKDKEIDFVSTKPGETLYIQVTLSLADEKVRQREIGNLLSIKDNHRKIVVTGDEYTANQQGVEMINIRKFLKEI